MGGRKDLKDLSDDELFALAETPAARPALSTLSDEELTALAGQQHAAPPAGGVGASLLSQYAAADKATEAHEADLQTKYGGIGGKLATLAEAIPRGLSLGGSDAISAGAAGLAASSIDEGPQLTPEARAKAAELGIKVPEAGAGRTSFGEAYEGARAEQQARREANPGLATTGELAGAIAPTMLTGGAASPGLAALRYSPAGLVERAGVGVAGRLAAPGAGLLARAGAGAAGGLTEGVLGTLAYEASQTRAADIADPKAAAEHLVTALGTGALLGGAAGGLFGGLARKGAGHLDEFGTTVDNAAIRPPSVVDAVKQVELDEQHLAPRIGKQAAEEQSEIEAGHLLNEAVSEIEQRPLRVDQLPEPERMPWQKLYEQARAAGGAFDTSLEESTRLVRANLDEIREAHNRIKEYAGMGAKKRANSFDEVVEASPLDAQSGVPLFPKSQQVAQAMHAKIDEMSAEIDSFAANRSKQGLSYGGGLGALETMRKEFSQTGALMDSALAQGKIGEAYHLFDQGIKGTIQRVHGVKTKGVPDLVERVHSIARNFLEDDGVFGEFVSNGMSMSQRQKLANKAITDSISASQDARLGGLFKTSSKKEVNGWDPLQLSSSATIKNVLSNVGDAGQDDVVEAYRTHLRATAREAVDVTRAWGSKATQADAARIVDATKMVDDAIERMGMLRRDKLAHEASLKGSTMQAVGNLLTSLGAQSLGGAVNMAVGAKRKLVEMLGQATSPQERAAIQAAIPPPSPLEGTVNQLNKSMGERIAGSASALLRVGAQAAGASTAATPFVVGAMLPAKRHQEVVQQSLALNNPGSPEAAALFQQAAQIERESPALANEYVASKLRVADYITKQLPKPTPGALYAVPPQLDPVTDRRVKRATAAAVDPVAAIDRMSRMQASPEDLDAVKTLFPSLYRNYQMNAKKQIEQSKTRPNYETRVRVGYTTGLPTDPTMEVGALTFLQQTANGPDMQKLEEGKAEAKNLQDAASMGPGPGGKFRDPGDVYSSRVDSIIDRR